MKDEGLALHTVTITFEGIPPLARDSNPLGPPPRILTGIPGASRAEAPPSTSSYPDQMTRVDSRDNVSCSGPHSRGP